MTLTVYAPPVRDRDEARREAAVRASGVLDASDDPQLRWMVESVRRSLRADVAAISILHQDWRYVVVASGTIPGVHSRRTSFCGHAIVGDDPVFCVADASRDARFAGNPYVEEGIVGFYAGVVLQGPEGYALGTLCVYDSAPRGGLTGFERSALVASGARVSERLAQRAEQSARPLH